MSNTFWAIFYGILVAKLAIFVIEETIHQIKWRYRKRQWDIFGDSVEDFLADDDDL